MYLVIKNGLIKKRFILYEEKYELINLEIWLKSKRKILLNFVEILSYYPIFWLINTFVKFQYFPRSLPLIWGWVCLEPGPFLSALFQIVPLQYFTFRINNCLRFCLFKKVQIVNNFHGWFSIIVHIEPENLTK